MKNEMWIEVAEPTYKFNFYLFQSGKAFCDGECRNTVIWLWELEEGNLFSFSEQPLICAQIHAVVAPYTPCEKRGGFVSVAW